jgi:hypothetical protein
MRITKKVAAKVAKSIKLNTDVVDIDTLTYALNVELEHGKRFGKLTNVSNDDINITVKIVLAHLIEFPDYYKRLRVLEEKADAYWSKREKPNIFL